MAHATLMDNEVAHADDYSKHKPIGKGNDMRRLYLCPLNFTKINTTLCTILHSCASVLQRTHIHVLLHNQKNQYLCYFARKNKFKPSTTLTQQLFSNNRILQYLFF